MPRTAKVQDVEPTRLDMRRDMQVVHLPVEELIPYARNARTHSDAQVAQIIGSMREFGWTNPVLLDEGHNIIAGHGRILAAKKLKLLDVPCIILEGLTEDQRRAILIADNKLSINAGWNLDLLIEELGDISAGGIDLNIVGFNEAEMAALLGGVAPSLNEDEDEAPPPPVIPVSALGDVWTLGRHRLVCGDCTDALVVEKALAGVTPHLMVTDPPYGAKSNQDWKEAYALFPGEVAYIWHDWKAYTQTVAGLAECGFEERAQIVWVKPQFVVSRGHYHQQHEPLLYAVKKSASGHWGGARDQSTVWQISSGGVQGRSSASPEDEKTGHRAQKPVECMRRPILNNSSPGQAVYEPFSGSGTTIIASETSGRACHAIELLPAFVDVAVKRWQKISGKSATLEGDGRTFDEIDVERQKP